MAVLEITDPDLDPTYLAACINASFNEPADLGTAVRLRDFTHLEIPTLESEGQQQVLHALAQLERMRKIADALTHQNKATTNAFLNVVRYGETTT